MLHVVGLTPAKFMCRHMGETSVTMRHHSLGADGGRCLAKAIAVSSYCVVNRLFSGLSQ